MIIVRLCVQQMSRDKKDDWYEDYTCLNRVIHKNVRGVRTISDLSVLNIINLYFNITCSKCLPRKKNRKKIDERLHVPSLSIKVIFSHPLIEFCCAKTVSLQAVVNIPSIRNHFDR